MKVKILSLVLVLVAFSLLLIPNANSLYNPLEYQYQGSNQQLQWERQLQMERQQLQLEILEIRRMEFIIGIIAPPEFLQILKPIADDLINRIQQRLGQLGNYPLSPSQEQQKPQTSKIPQNPLSPISPPQEQQTPQSPSSPKKGPVNIAVVDIFGDPNGLDNTIHHGDLVAGTIRDSMSEGVDYAITKIDLCKYRERTGTQPIYTKDGNVVIDGIIYHDYRNLSSNGFQHDYREIGVVISASGLLKALEAARRSGADVINMSNGFSNSMGNALKDEFARLRNAGIIVVAAAGNDGQYGASYPARDENVIGVGAPAEYSNYGPGVTLKANGNYKGYQGTSFSAPRVAAAVAALLSRGVLPENIRSEILALCNGGYLSDSVIAGLGRDTSSYITRRPPSYQRSTVGAGIGGR